MHRWPLTPRHMIDYIWRMETIERALDFAINEHESNRLAFEANERFFKSGGVIKDVYGKLDG